VRGGVVTKGRAAVTAEFGVTGQLKAKAVSFECLVRRLSRESRAGSSVAEQGTFNPLVVGSNPTRLAIDPFVPRGIVKRLLVSIGLIAVLWIAAFVGVGTVLGGGLRPIHQVGLIGGIWVVALVVGFFRFNPDGEFRWYVVLAGITLAAAALFVGIAAPAVFPEPPPITPA
jgi:hypothetical protein